MKSYSSTALLPVEFREQSGEGDALATLSGIVVVYGDVAKIGMRLKERFAPGSLTYYERGVGANVQHDRSKPLARYPDAGLRFVNGAKSLRAEIDLPDTSAGRDALVLVRARVLTGLSVEFRARDQDVSESGDLFTVKRATITGVGLVDLPAYPQSELDAIRGALDVLDNPPEPPQRRRRLWH